MVRPVLATSVGVLLAAKASGLYAAPLSDANLERYVANHQQACVAALREKLSSAGYALPFGYVDNYCLCMGKAMFSGMNQAQAQKLINADGGPLPESVAARKTEIRNECVASTTSMYTADLRNRSN